MELSTRHDYPQNDFTLENRFATLSDYLRYTPVLMQTPWFFKMSPPWHLSYLDKFSLDGILALGKLGYELPTPTGSWLPFYYNDKKDYV